MGSGIFLGFGIAACVAMLALFGWFLFRFFIYGYVGNLYFYVGCAFAICVVLSLVVYTNPIPINSTETLIVNNVPKGAPQW